MKGTPPFTRKAAQREFITPSSAGLGPLLRASNRTPLLRGEGFAILESATSVWLIVHAGKALRIGVRLFTEPNGFARVTARAVRGGAEVTGRGEVGKYTVRLGFSKEGLSAFHLETSVVPAKAVRWPAGARDVCLMNARFEPLEEGMVYTHQTGPTAGQTFVSALDTFVFYFQNLTTLGPFSRLADVKLDGCVGVEWPELGLCLPGGSQLLPAGRKIVLSDTYLRTHPGPVDTEPVISLRFLDDLYATYLAIRRPDPTWYDWQDKAAQTVADLSRSKYCSRKVRGGTFMNAYVGSSDKPPESMVQAALLVPLLEYEGWLGKPLPLVKRLGGALGAFFNEKLGCPVRWLPGCKFLKDVPGEEEVAGRMDSWYLFHTLMNLGRLAGFGRERDRELFIGSLAYAIRTAHHFKYDWPVFFDMESLKVEKEETERGGGGEQDAAGLYAHVMMQAWSLTREAVYLKEAEAAARKLTGLGFGVLYQTNNTMFGAVALAWLWKETGNALYKDLSFVSMGSILSHLWLWEPDAPGRSWRTFMGLPPLHDAPYIAAYEEAEIHATAAAYLEALGPETPESIVSLVVEYGKNLLDRGRYYFPSHLDPDFLCDEPKEGQMEPSLAVPVEDLYPSEAKAGQVGQEVYGAAAALILAARSYHRWEGVPFQVWCNGLLTEAEFDGDLGREGSLVLRIAGSPRCRYDVRLITRRRTLRLSAETEGRRRKMVEADGHSLFRIRGGEKVVIRWTRGGAASSRG